MVNNRYAIMGLVVLGFLFQALFYKHNMGLNTLLFSIIFTGYLFAHNKLPQSITSWILLLGMITSAVGVIVGHTDYSKVIYWLTFVIMLGAVVVPNIRYLHFAPLFAVNAIGQFKESLTQLLQASKTTNSNIKISFWLRFVLTPMVLFFVLLLLYAASNKYFSNSISEAFEQIEKLLNFISIGRFWLAAIGGFIGLYFLINTLSPTLINKHLAAQTLLIRTRKHNGILKGLSKRLIRQQQVSVVFFVLINLMAAWLNILDVRYIWLGFTWDGGYLKEMVHEGTYLLIIAILISMAIALYYLNGNLVFIKKHKTFQTLITIWLVQNVIMVISVVFRNIYYIQYFGLAYKRIFVFFFLAACVIGLISIIYKSLRYKSATYLLAINSVSVYVWCIMAGLFNWDAIIARYNFNHYKSSFVHYDFLIGLNDASLPYIVTNNNTLKEIDSLQTKRFAFTRKTAYSKISFSQHIESRKKYFSQTWPQTNWLDWNLPEWQAYKLIKQEE